MERVSVWGQLLYRAIIKREVILYMEPPERPGLKVFRAGVLLWEHVLNKKRFRPFLGENDVAIQCSKCW